MIFWMLQNLLLTATNKKCRNVYGTTIITRWKEQYIYWQEKWKSCEKLLLKIPNVQVKNDS